MQERTRLNQVDVGDRLAALRAMYPNMRLSQIADRIAPEINGLVPVPYSNGTTTPLLPGVVTSAVQG